MGNTNFKIDAHSCTLFGTDESKAILRNGVLYQVPIYQRPYSWGEKEITRFLSDIIHTYYSNAEDPESIFMGTMQFAPTANTQVYDVIDGQQRLTTILLLLEVLRKLSPENVNWKFFQWAWLKSEVSNQQEELEEALDFDMPQAKEVLNKYITNLNLLECLVLDKLTNNGSYDFIELDRFITYLLSKVYFVVIETHAGLSKTLQIFNSINTTGLDLAGADVFKIKMYEYLTQNESISRKDVFKQIDALYSKIDEKNKLKKRKDISMNHALDLYRFFLIGKYNLPVILYGFGVDQFYERLFDTLLGLNKGGHFEKHKENISLSLSELDGIIDSFYSWDVERYTLPETAISLRLIRWSRYRRYWVLLVLFINKLDEQEKKLIHRFTPLLTKLIFIFSIRFDKVVKEIRSDLVNSLVSKIVDPNYTPDQIIDYLREELNKQKKFKLNHLNGVLAGEIFFNAKRKNLICIISALLDDKRFKSTDSKDSKELEKLFFEKEIDIEHIQASKDFDESKRKDILLTWGAEINCLGNLVILERSKNRSISNKVFGIKRASYTSSEFEIVKNIAANNVEWTKEHAMARKAFEVNRIMNYLFSDV